MLFRTKRTPSVRPSIRPFSEGAPTAPTALADESRAVAVTADANLATLELLGKTAIATVTVSELTGSAANRLVNDLLAEFVEARVHHFVFDLQNVTYMDSACIGSLVELLTKIQTAGGRIALVNAGQSVSYLFKLTKLDRLFPICRDVMQAIAAVERAG